MDGTVRLLLLLVFICWLPAGFASHFRGAIITWKPEKTDPSKIIIDFRISWRMSFSSYFHCDKDTITSGTLIGNSDQLSCFSNCYGNLGTVNYKCTDFSSLEDWSSGRGTAVFSNPPDNKQFEFGYTGGAWIRLNHGGNGDWTLRVSADLTPRPDGSINSSPVVEISPIVRLQRGCSHTIALPVSDPDGDVIRCRWANSHNNECGSICSSFPHSTLIQDSCEITYMANYSLGWYGVAVQVEDFASHNSSKPLSSVPVQFLVYVFESTDATCTQATTYVSPTPPDNACIGVPINTTYEGTIAVQTAGNRSISDIKTISPVGLSKGALSKRSDGVWTMNITWDTKASGRIHNTFCFTAAESTGSTSEKRCISLLAGVNPPVFDGASMNPSQKWSQPITTGGFQLTWRVFLAFNDTEVEAIDASDRAKVTMGPGQRGLQFTTSITFIERQEYYILLDFGVVRSKEYCGVESLPVTDPHYWRFRIRDVTPPKMIHRNVPGTTNSTAHLSWLFDEAVGVYCWLEDPNGHKSAVPCDSSWSGTQLKNGDYYLRVQATDMAGNQGVIETLKWTVDTLPPVVTLISFPAKLSNKTQVEIRWISSETSSFQCRLLPSDWSVCQHARFTTALPKSASGTELSFEVQATDTVGNIGDIVSYNWTGDFEPPTIGLCGDGIRLSVACNQSLQPEKINCVARATDTLDKQPTLTYKDVSSSSPNCDIIRTWTSSDAAGNTVSINQTIHVTVNKPIQILKAPGQISVACGTLKEKELENVLISSFEVHHPCGMPVMFNYTDSPNTTQCDVMISRIWTISDSCGTTARQISQPIRVMHVHNPLSPENGQVGTDVSSLYLRWPESGKQTKFEVYVWEKSTARPSQPMTTTYSNYYELTNLKPDTQYLWQIEILFSSNDTYVGPVWGFQTRKFTDLVVKSITLPSTGYSGQQYEIQWTVMNVGKLLAQGSWYDEVYLSFTDKFLEANQLSRVYQHNIIMPNDGYSSKATVKFGDDQIGTAYFWVKTNVLNGLEELNTTNNVLMKTMEVKLTPPPDLTVSSIVIPKSSYSGQPISIRWTVVNHGQGSTVTGRWNDRVWWSRDNVKDSSDTILGYGTRAGDLAPGNNYTLSISVRVPEFITGDFFILIETDCYKQVFEFNSEGNNIIASKSSVSVILTPPPDLEVTSVTTPPSVMTGDQLIITWKVTNTGDRVPASQPYWQDRVELSSTSSTWRKVLQYKSHYGILGPSASYTAIGSYSVTADIPSGTYTVTVSANHDRRLFEYTNTANNEKTSNRFTITRALPDLHVYNFTLVTAPSGEAVYLQADWTVGNIGKGKTLSEDWVDTLRLTFPRHYGNSILLRSTSGGTSGLPAGQTYTVSKTFLVPPEVYGHSEITLTVDDEYQKTGDGDRRDNTASQTVNIPLFAPDLKILNNMSISGDMVGGNPLRVTYTVQNRGNKEIKNMKWSNKVMISTHDGNYDCRNTCEIKNFHEMDGSLSKNDTYTVVSNFMLPESMSGSYLVSVHADYRSNIFEGPNENNNELTTDIQVKAAPKADLSLLHIQSKLLGDIGEDKILNIEWTVKNTGNSMKLLKTWRDSVGFIKDGNTAQFIVLNSFKVFHKLGASSEYSSHKTVIVPSSVEGNVQFCVYADSSAQLKEAFSRQDNFLCEKKELVIKMPSKAKLQATVTNVTAVKDGYIAPGADLYISFTVKNTGDRSTDISSWIDSVYIINTAPTSVELLKATGTSVAEITHVGALRSKEHYSVTQIITIPDTFSGNVMLYILPNNSDQALFSGATGNGESIFSNSTNVSNVTSAIAAKFATTLVVKGLLPNMLIDMNTTLRDLSGGQPVTVQYEVTNNGKAPLNRYWYDAVYISDDFLLDVFDTKLKTVLRMESIDVNETIQHNITFILPFDMDSKSYFLIFKVDSRDDIFEENEADNIKRVVIEMQQRTSTDIYVTNVRSPSTTSFSHAMKVEWTVMNNGSKAASGYKCDSAYLSDDNIWDITDAIVGKPQCTSFTLRSNTSFVHSRVIANTPAVAAGSYNTLVKSRSNIIDVNQENNVAVAKNRTQVIINALIIGTPANETLSYNSLKLFHVPNVPLDKTLIINVTADCMHCFNVFTKGGSPAKLYDFDQTSTNLNRMFSVLTVPGTQTSDYYILIQNTDTTIRAHSLTVSVKIAKFEIIEVFPTNVMKGVDVTLRVQGTLFPDDVRAYIDNVASKENIEATGVYCYSSTEIYATFNIEKSTALVNGTLRLFSPSTKKTTIYSGTVSVTQGVTGYLTTLLSPIGSLRNNDHGFVSMTIENSGDSDMLVPLVLVQAAGDGDIKFIDKNSRHVYKQEYFLIGSPDSGPAGILPPKAYSRFYFDALQNVELGRGGKFSAAMDITVSTVTADTEVSNPFLDQKEAMKPPHYDDKSWEPVWENFIAMTGNSTHSLMTKISKVLNEMSLVNHHAWMVDDMIRYLLQMADSPMGDKMDVVEVDVAVETDSAVGLVISRHMSSRIGARSQTGPMGKGWILPLWDTKIKTVYEDLMVVSIAKKDVVFVKMEDGMFSNLKTGNIWKSGDEYILMRHNDNQQYHFDSLSLMLVSVVSLVDTSRIDLTYADGKLARVTHARGSYVDISYDSSGRIASMEVHNTSVPLLSQERHSLYEYAVEGNSLRAVNVNGKRTRYDYNSDASIRLITHSDNTMTVYEYSSSGHMTAKRFVVHNSQVSAAEYRYHDSGTVTVTMLPGNHVTNLTLDRDGEIVLVRRDKFLPVRTVKTRNMVTDLEGNFVVTRRLYNHDQKSVRIEDGNGESVELVYDDVGQLQQFLDGGANAYTFSYNNMTRALNQISFPDGSNITYTYSEHKQYIKKQSGAVKTLEFNEQNQLITKTSSNGDIISYEYGNNGRLLQVTSEDDTIKLAYNGRKPVEIAYPDNTIHYEYESDDKLKKMYTDDDYAVEYVYDDNRQVRQVIDGHDNKTLVKVTYTATGKIKRKSFGNNATTIYEYDKDTDLLKELRNYYPNGTVASYFKYIYSPRQRRISMETKEGVWEFEYDTAGQVTMMKSPDGTVTKYRYDNRKNRKTVSVNGSEKHVTVNDMNQYDSYGSTTLAYDENGNMVEKNGTERVAYSFDEDNRLVEMVTGKHDCSFQYDPLGNLKAKVCNGARTRYLTDPFGYLGSTIIEQISASGDKIQMYYGGEQIGLIGLKNENGINYFQYDPLGSVVGILNENGDLLNWYQSDPFGQVIKSHESLDSPFTFIGQWGVVCVKESPGIYFMRARMYDSELGRFLSMDPDKISARSKNFYAYCSNNPVHCKDPEGEWWWVAAKTVWGGVSGGFKYWYTHSNDGSFTWGGMAGATLEGTLNGLISSIPKLPGPVQTLLEGGTHVLGSGLEHLINGDKYTGKQAWHDYVDFEVNAWEDKALDKVFGDLLPKGLKMLAKDAPAWVKTGIEVGTWTLPKLGKLCGMVEFWSHSSFPLCHPQDALKDALNKAAAALMKWLLSHDPNDFIGPKGYGAARFIKGDESLSYKIRFENDENATAPAHRVYIEHRYSKHLDPRSFTMGDFGFGDVVKDVPDGSKFFQGSLNLTSELGIFVSIVAGLDITKQMITWELQSIDPATGEAPRSADAGFLPPNNGTSGQGYVTFTMTPRADSPHLTVISANASIYFDENEPIDTPNIFNTIDKVAPVSNGSAVEQMLASGTAAVQISTDDSGSGVDHVQLFLKQDDSMTLLKSAIIDTVVSLPLKPGANYTLVPVAVDHVGNRQSLEPAEAEDTWILVNYFFADVGTCNCSGHGNCSEGTTVCLCDDGYYGENCNSIIPPHEPPILDMRASRGLQGKPVAIFLSAHNQSGPIDYMSITITGFPTDTTFTAGKLTDQTSLVLEYSEFGQVNMSLPGSFYGNLTLHVNVNETSKGLSVTRTGELSLTVNPDTSQITVDFHGCFFGSNNKTAVRLNTTVSFPASIVPIPYSLALTLPEWASLEGGKMLGGSTYLLQNNVTQYVIHTLGTLQPFNVTVVASFSAEGVSSISRQKEINMMCAVCSGLHYGPNCSKPCPCNGTNTISCDPMQGTCLCDTHWTGARCDMVIDECSNVFEACRGDNHTVCQNRAGGHDCLCRRGFQSVNNTCTEIITTVSPVIVTPLGLGIKETNIEVKFNVYIPSTDNLDAAYTYKKYEHEASQMLSSYYRSMMGYGFIRVVIVDLRRGSLIVDHQVVTRDQAFVQQELGYAMHQLSQKKNLTFFGQTVSAEDMKIGGVPVTGSGNGTMPVENPCKVFVAIRPCGASEECVLEKGLPTCRSTQVVIVKTDDKDKDNDHRDRTLLMVIFIPVGVLLLIFVTCVTRSYCRDKKGKKDSGHDNIELQFAGARSKQFRSVDSMEAAKDGSQHNPAYRMTEPMNQEPGNYTREPGNYTREPGNYTREPGNYTGGPDNYTRESDNFRLHSAASQEATARDTASKFADKGEARLDYLPGSHDEPKADY